MQRVLDEVLAGRPPTAEDVPNLPYTGQVFAEAMRLYPPAWAISRRLTEPVEVAGRVLPAKSVVMVSPWVIHRDSRWWPEPETFRPERFAEGASHGRPKQAYMPYGLGNRMCIGSGFATLEGTLVLATIAQRMRLRAVHSGRPEALPRVTLRPLGSLEMVVEERTPQ
jgi:cytochrome P450